MAKTKPEAEAAEPDTITKAEAVRRALADKIDAPSDIAAYAKERYGLEITPAQASTYKSIAKKKAGASTRRPRAASQSRALAVPAPTAGSVSESLAAVKQLVDQLGYDEVVKIAGIFRG